VAELTREIEERIEERSAILGAFPELGNGNGNGNGAGRRRVIRIPRVDAPVETPVKKKHGYERTAEQRAAVSKRMKAHWRAKRASQRYQASR